MKCADCGRDNPAGARYCIHCGAEQSLPTPIAAAAAIASRARRGIPQAANAAHADPVPEEQPHPTENAASPATSAAAPRATIVPYPSGASATGRHDALAAPAYAKGPRRSGIALSIIVACFFVAVGGFFAWRMFAPQVGMPSAVEKVAASASGSPPTAASGSEPATKAEERAADRETAAPAASPVIAQPTEPAQSAAPVVDSTPANATVESKATVAQPVEITPLPAKPAARPPRKAALPEPAQQAPPSVATAGPPPAAPAPHPAPAAPIVATAAPKATKADPWTKLREELETCTREDFITRVVCGQRVRFKYCAGSWGKVPECPGSPQGDHGQ